jgi:hypothetical protein
MNASRQHRVDIDFTGLNSLQVPIVYLTMALLPLIALLTLRRKGFSDIGELATVTMLALLGNAVVFGAFATAHNRYGARMVWLAPFVVMLALIRLYERRRARGEIPRLPHGERTALGGLPN